MTDSSSTSSTAGLKPPTQPAQQPAQQPAKQPGLLGRYRLPLAWLLVLAVALVASVVAVNANPPPATEAARAAELKENTLCPVCDGQNVLESNAPVATAIRRQIDELVAEERTDEEIRTFLARQYGDDVNALPPGSGWGSLVWVLPVVGFLTATAAVVLLYRRWLSRQQQQQQQHHRSRAALTLVLLAAAAIVIGFVVARSAGLASPGETITGEIDRSARSLLFDANNFYAQGEDEQARELVNEILGITNDLPDALVLSARLYEREGEVLSAIVELDQVLSADPAHIDALTLRGWLLVRIPDEELIAEGIVTLDAAIAQEPDQFDPWVFRGYVARVIEGDLPLAIELYEAALDRSPPPAMSDQLTGLIEQMSTELANQR